MYGDTRRSFHLRSTAVGDRRLEFLHFCRANRKHPGASAPPLLNQEGSAYKLPSSDEEGPRPWRGGGAEPEMPKLEAVVGGRRSNRRRKHLCPFAQEDGAALDWLQPRARG